MKLPNPKLRKPKLVVRLAPEVHALEVSYVMLKRDVWVIDSEGWLRDTVERGIIDWIGRIASSTETNYFAATRTLRFNYDSEKAAHQAAEVVFNLYAATGARKFTIRVTESAGYVAEYQRAAKGESKSFSMEEHGHRCDHARAFAKRLGIPGAKNPKHRSRVGNAH